MKSLFSTGQQQVRTSQHWQQAKRSGISMLAVTFLGGIFGEICGEMYCGSVNKPRSTDTNLLTGNLDNLGSATSNLDYLASHLAAISTSFISAFIRPETFIRPEIFIRPERASGRYRQIALPT
jgi:hypothetical protein